LKTLVDEIGEDSGVEKAHAVRLEEVAVYRKRDAALLGLFRLDEFSGRGLVFVCRI
jgi:hypothetical protein